MKRQQQHVIEYLVEEKRALKYTAKRKMNAACRECIFVIREQRMKFAEVSIGIELRTHP